MFTVMSDSSLSSDKRTQPTELENLYLVGHAAFLFEWFYSSSYKRIMTDPLLPPMTTLMMMT
jgi:hypothetical protein